MTLITFGSNRLIASGEKCVLNELDILKTYSHKLYKLKKAEDLKNDNYESRKIKRDNMSKIYVSDELKSLYDAVTKKGISIDELCEKTNQSAQKILTQLTMLEMQGIIVQYPGKIFAKK